MEIPGSKKADQQNDVGDSNIDGENQEEDEMSDYVDENFELDETDEFWGIETNDNIKEFLTHDNDIKQVDKKNFDLKDDEELKI